MHPNPKGQAIHHAVERFMKFAALTTDKHWNLPLLPTQLPGACPQLLKKIRKFNETSSRPLLPGSVELPHRRHFGYFGHRLVLCIVQADPRQRTKENWLESRSVCFCSSLKTMYQWRFEPFELKRNERNKSRSYQNKYRSDCFSNDNYRLHALL